jgi:hypothetical protein
VDRPVEFRGRTALYGRRHVLQLTAIKRMQAKEMTQRGRFPAPAKRGRETRTAAAFTKHVLARCAPRRSHDALTVSQTAPAELQRIAALNMAPGVKLLLETLRVGNIAPREEAVVELGAPRNNRQTITTGQLEAGISLRSGVSE